MAQVGDVSDKAAAVATALRHGLIDQEQW